MTNRNILIRVLFSGVILNSKSFFLFFFLLLLQSIIYQIFSLDEICMYFKYPQLSAAKRFTKQVQPSGKVEKTQDILMRYWLFGLDF